VRGVHGPTDRTLYDAVLDGLQEAGLEMKESVSKVRDGESVGRRTSVRKSSLLDTGTSGGLRHIPAYL